MISQTRNQCKCTLRNLPQPHDPFSLVKKNLKKTGRLFKTESGQNQSGRFKISFLNPCLWWGVWNPHLRWPHPPQHQPVQAQHRFILPAPMPRQKQTAQSINAPVKGEKCMFIETLMTSIFLWHLSFPYKNREGSHD